MKKKQLGQFFTINSDYILKNLEKFIKNKKVIDPFAGSGDLMKWAKKQDAKSVKGYDVDKKYINKRIVFLNDSINNPKDYEFILTNPPYLNVNKANKETKEKYFKKKHQFEDLYQISLASIMNSQEGIVIIPINFLSAENSKKIRDLFFSKFRITEMNYFKQQVFPDTTYNVIAFYYKKKKNLNQNKFSIKTHIYPDNKIINIELFKNFHWSIGGEIEETVKEQKNLLGVKRLVETDIFEENGSKRIKAAYNHIDTRLLVRVPEDKYKIIKSNIILLKAIDSGTEQGKIALEDIRKYKIDCLISKPTSRHMIYLIFESKQLSISEQRKIIDLFNKEISRLRNDQFSLFLTNYRDKNRKRISFDFVYKFINYLYLNKIKNGGQKTLFAQS